MDKIFDRLGIYGLLRIVQTVQKSSYGRIDKKSSNELTSLFEWSQFCFELNSLVVVKVNVPLGLIAIPAVSLR